jgi:pseudouridine-5'-phosphate glycosidase
MCLYKLLSATLASNSLHGIATIPRKSPPYYVRFYYIIPLLTRRKLISSQLDSQWQLGMTNGALIAAPIPEQYEASGAEIQKSVEQAIRESEGNGVARQGKDATPWLLNRIAELTQGKSLKNSALDDLVYNFFSV